MKTPLLASLRNRKGHTANYMLSSVIGRMKPKMANKSILAAQVGRSKPMARI